MTDRGTLPDLADALSRAERGEWAAALEMVERATEAAPDSVDGWLAKGRILKASGGDQGAALRAFRRATECGAPPPLRVLALREYALALERIGRHKEAAAALEEALALLERERRQDGSCAPAAEDRLRGELCDLLSRAHERLGDIGRALERHREAEAHFREGQSDLGAFYAREAELLERLGRTGELFQCYARLVETAPDRVLFAQPDETRPKAVVRERLRRLLHAINQHMLANRSDWVARIVKAGFFFRLGRYRHAEHLIEKAQATAHDHFYPYHLLAKIRLRSGRPGAALEALERARPLAPDYVDFERDRALALEGCLKRREALEVYRRIEAKWPGRRDLLLRAAKLREDLELFEEAYETYVKAAALEKPPAREELEKLAQLAIRLERPREAEAHLDAALAVARRDGRELRLVRSAAREARGDLGGALDDLAALMAECPDRQDGLYREALARKVSLLVRLDRDVEALSAADELDGLEGGEDERTLVLRGDALRAAKRFNESVQCYTAAADRKLASALIDAGAKLFERADYTGALGSFNESFRRNPQSWEVFYFAAAAYARLAQSAPAAKYLEAAAKVNRGALSLMEKDADFDAVRASAEVQGIVAAFSGTEAP